ncbi:MAG: GGDEF domain-containing protein [Atopobiaceae bacterium]|nr:GGDEF domain-containing protein [Atopobiaceae bacterium]
MRTFRIAFNLRTLLIAAILCLVTAMTFFAPPAAHAQETGKTVRVGWYESPFNATDQFGRRSGYAYDYQQKIAGYTGWNYEYVEGSWPELLQMLADGKIDLMSDVSYTDERAKTMLFPSLPMGAEEYYIFISPNNKEINKDDLSTFNGKKVGVNKGSVQAEFFHKWAKANGVRAELIEMTEDVDESLDMLNRGDIDMYVVLDGYLDARLAVPVCKVGASDFFFAVNKSRRDLLSELNAAMNRIQEEDHSYHRQLYEKYLKGFGFNYYLSTEEKSWLSGHGPIRVGYQDNFLSFCAADKRTGELTGALKDYLEEASGCFENADLDFEPKAYPSAAAALEALRKGEVDCMFPSNLSSSDGEELDLVMTPSVMTSEVYAIVDKDDQHTVFQKEQVTAAVVEGDPNDATVMMDHFPDWQRKEYPDTQACLKAVADKKADCVLISNYQYNDLGRQCDRLGLTALDTGKTTDYCLAIRGGDTSLYSILTRTTDIVSNTNINAALSYYSAEEAKTTLVDFIRDNPAIDVAVVGVTIALLAIIVAQQRVIRAKKEVEVNQHRVDDLSKRVFVDALTSVRNKGAFNEYTQGLQEKLDDEGPLAFAAIILDCDNLKKVNDQYGHERGDVYIKTACQLICRVFKHSPVFRIGGDEFAVILQNADYQNRKELMELFEKNMDEINASAENEWEQVSVSLGMAEYDPQSDDSVDDVVHHADKAMYDNKRARKGRSSVR